MNRFFFVLIGLLFFSSAAFAFFGLFERPSPMILINQTDINGDHVSVDFLNSFDINAGNITALSIDVNAVHANYFVARNFIDSNFLNDVNFLGGSFGVAGQSWFGGDAYFGGAIYGDGSNLTGISSTTDTTLDTNAGAETSWLGKTHEFRNDINFSENVVVSEGLGVGGVATNGKLEVVMDNNEGTAFYSVYSTSDPDVHDAPMFEIGKMVTGNISNPVDSKGVAGFLSIITDSRSITGDSGVFINTNQPFINRVSSTGGHSGSPGIISEYNIGMANDVIKYGKMSGNPEFSYIQVGNFGMLSTVIEGVYNSNAAGGLEILNKGVIGSIGYEGGGSSVGVTTRDNRAFDATVSFYGYTPSGTTHNYAFYVSEVKDSNGSWGYYNNTAVDNFMGKDLSCSYLGTGKDFCMQFTGTDTNFTAVVGSQKLNLNFDEVYADGNMQVNDYLSIGKTVHVYGGFQDKMVTVPATEDVWSKVTNSDNNLFVGLEFDGMSLVDDNMFIIYGGDYSGHVSLTVSGANGNDYYMRIYNTTQSTQMGYIIGATMTGATNFTNVSLPIYVEANTGDYLQLQIMNVTNDNDPLVRSAVFYMNKLHE